MPPLVHVSITDEQKDRFLQDVVACYAPGHPMQAVVEAVYMMYVPRGSGRSHYRQLCRGGYPLGSGRIESSNKFICHIRLKRSGAWWS